MALVASSVTSIDPLWQAMQLDGVPKHREHDELHASHVEFPARTKLSRSGGRTTPRST